MTRKLLTALVLMLIGIGQAQSNPVGRQDAMKKAQEFLQSKGKSFAASSVRRVPSNQPDDDYQPYYLFNVGNREGFVVAAGDDRVPAILGYADDGMLLPDSLPSNMKAWLELYEQQIRYIQENDIDVSSALFASNHPKISPLLTTTWDQTDPYNQSCPDFFTYGKCVTGCVATAMAQVMFYHRDNSVNQTQKTIPAYTCRTKWNMDGTTQQIQVSAVPAGSVIDWDNMLNDYSSSATAKQEKAVADLMFYCGASVSMNYADAFNGGSGAYSSDVPAALKTYFDYSDNTQLASRSSYSSDEAWDNLIYNELSQQRPVLYTGSTSSLSGHAFVCDGYDGNGYYHINWGWGSYCDGNFLLTNLTPEDQGTGGSSGGYNNNQKALIGAVPNGGSTPPVGTSVVLNATNFPDAKFRAYISDITGVAEGGTLSEEKLKSVTRIDVSGTYSANGGITSLKGVEHFTALTYLYCACNQLPSLDVSHNTALEYLSCYNNQLPSLDVSHNTALTTLWCYRNQLPSLDVSHNTALTELDCGSNQLPSLDVSHNTALTSLSCYNNQLSSLDVSHNTALTYLKCYNNQLMSLDLSKCTKLESGYTSVSSQSKSVVASSLGSNQYSIDVPADLNLSKVSSFTVNSGSVTPTLSNGKLQFTSSTVPTSVTYQYNTDNSVAGNMKVTVTVTSIEEASGIVLNATNFPDAKFRAYISDITGVAEGGTLSEEKLKSVTSIDVSGTSSANGGITSLKGVEHFTALTQLFCAYNQLSSLDVSHNIALTQLSCSNNKLPSLDVSHNIALTQLSCHYNQLSSLDVSHNTALTKLSCYNNQLTSLDVSHNTALIYLYCNDNQLPSLDVSQNTALTTLTCSSNQLPSLDVSHNTALKNLGCYNNQLTSLDVSHNTALATLYCENNQLPSLDVSHNTALIYLKCYSNQLMSLDLSKCTRLKSGYTSVSSQSKSVVASSLGSNQYSIDVPADFNLSKVSSFTVNSVSVTPTLSNGKLQFTSSTVPTSVTYQYNTDNSVAGNMKVTVTVTSIEEASGVVLNATNFPDAKFRAYISSITGVAEGGTLSEEKLKSVTSIIVHGSPSANGGITSLKGVEHFTALTYLSCSYNQLPSLDVSHNTALTELYCDNNQLPSLDVSHNTALSTLDCDHNQLPSLDVSHNTALYWLSCDNNQLPSLDVSQNTALKYLYCENNQLPSLDVSHNTVLTRLRCYNNQLMSLDLSKCTKLLGSGSNSTSVSSQSKSVVASSLGSNQYSIDVPADFNLSKVSSFTVNSVSVTSTLSNGKLQFTSSTVPTSVTYQYNTDNSVVGNMEVTVTITDVEDAVPANTVYMDDMEVMTGMEETLSVKMKNEVPMEGFEFDLYVPEGVTVATDGDGFPEVYLSSERTTARKTNSFDAIFLPDGGVRVLAASTNGSAISGNDGEIVTVKVNIGADMAEGDYTVLLKNIALSGTDAVSHPTEQMSSTLHVTYGILGDANRDKRVDVADFTTTAHHILGKNPDPFNDKAANANRDERIDVGDLTAIAHIILYGSVDKPANGANGLPRRAPATDSGEQGGEGYPTNYVYIDPVSAESGTEQTLSVKMKNAVDAEGFEFDLYLPEGMSFVLDADGFPEATLSTERTTTRKTNSFDAVIQPDGALRVLAASTNGSVISGHDGEVALVKVRIDGDVPTGTYLLTLKEIAVSDVDCVSHRTDELVSDITVESGSPTSLGGVVTDGDDDNTYYNMSGQRINKPTRSGVYIQHGKKVVVK